ncbi:MAG TPA: head GIN domain-containing protein [Sphingopyxis sp.]|uniref:head GIN domain-containing protein n=1 Tax=Sphingopyxis sp. TaxID=1908224 RepID=UPI002D192105|nr:head GIN domain-containing protein [Sphingopyxis sp.]HWW57248.1 head GIN domain-containing protein [Sphingopyxis sp.]
MTLVPRCAAIAAAALLFAGPATAAEKRFGLTSFEVIEVNADYIIEVAMRAPVGAVATGPQDALDRLSVEARDGRLIIGQRQFAGDEKRRTSRGAVTIRINAATLRSATMGGAGSLQIDRLKGNRVVVGLRGPGRLSVGAIETDRLSVMMIGNGTMTLGGTAKQAQMTLSGAGLFDAGTLAVDELIFDSEGAGDHMLNAVKRAAVTTRGIGRTVVLGRPVCTVRNLGSGSVQCGNAKK